MAGTLQQLIVAVEAWLGNPDWTRQNILAFDSTKLATALQAAAIFIDNVTLPVGGAIQTVNLASIFPAATNVQLVGIIDISGQIFKFNTLGVSIPANSPIFWVQNGGTPPTLQLSNPSGTATGEVAIVLASQ